jgi:hypothetical protein
MTFESNLDVLGVKYDPSTDVLELPQSLLQPAEEDTKLTFDRAGDGDDRIP